MTHSYLVNNHKTGLAKQLQKELSKQLQKGLSKQLQKELSKQLKKGLTPFNDDTFTN